jgi:hypothetical protein
MKTKLIALILFIFLLGLTNCSSDDTSSPDCQKDESLRKGAICKDGTETSATGAGACSGHGGVEYWICK